MNTAKYGEKYSGVSFFVVRRYGFPSYMPGGVPRHDQSCLFADRVRKKHNVKYRKECVFVWATTGFEGDGHRSILIPEATIIIHRIRKMILSEIRLIA